jgi:guanyl-specific ribonuclease Sa
LATEIEQRVPLFSEDPGRWEWVAPDEAHLLDTLRRSLSEGNSAVTMTGETGAARVRRLSSAAEAAAPAVSRRDGSAAPDRISPPEAPPGRTKDVPIRAEDLITLLQAGERAMRDTSRAVTIEQP